MTDAEDQSEPDPGIEHHKILIPYAMRPQFKGFHETRKRFGVTVAHRGGGKTVAAINKLIRGALECESPNGRFSYIGPWFSQAKDIAWGYLKQYSEPAWRAPPNEQDLRVELVNGASIRLYGSDNPDRLRGVHPHGVVMDEFASQRTGVWSSIVRPSLAINKGWVMFIGTPKGRNAFYDVWKGAQNNSDWFKLMLRGDTAGILSAEELEAMQEEMSPEEFDQEILCSFEAAIQGAYYSEALRRMDAEGRIVEIPIDRAARVHTAWDLGRADATAIWFIQCVGRERRLVDYYEYNNVGFEHYAQVLHDKRQERGWIYGQHYFPHDVKAHMMDSALSRLDTLRSLGIEATYPAQAHEVIDGINAVRRMLDRTYIDPVRCERGLDCLRNYRSEWDDKMRVFKNLPRHDEHSHGADALRCFATQYDDPRSVSHDGSYRRRFKGGGPSPSSWSA